MNNRLHVMLQVADLDDSIRFYSTLFDTTPTVRKNDYAKWMLEDPRVNFSIAAHGDSLGVEHLGIQAETPQGLEVLRERLARTRDAAIREEGETTCCYHHSDKTWVTDGQGVSWEIFHTSGEANTYHAPVAAGEGRGDGCCASDCCSDAAGA